MFGFADITMFPTMFPTIVTSEVFHSCGELLIPSSEPYDMTAPTSIGEISPYQTICPDLLQPVLRESLSVANEHPVEENSIIRIPQVVANETTCPKVPKGSKLGSTATRAHRSKTRNAPKTTLQERSLEELSQLIEQATSDEERRMLNQKRRAIRNNISTYVSVEMTLL